MKSLLIFAKFHYSWFKKEFYIVMLVNLLGVLLNFIVADSYLIRLLVFISSALVTINWYTLGGFSTTRKSSSFSWKYLNLICQEMGRLNALFALYVSRMFSGIPLAMFIFANLKVIELFISDRGYIFSSNVLYDTTAVFGSILIVSSLLASLGAFQEVYINLVIPRRTYRPVQASRNLVHVFKIFLDLIFYVLPILIIIGISISLVTGIGSQLPKDYIFIYVFAVGLILLLVLQFTLFRSAFMYWNSEERSYIDYGVNLKKLFRRYLPVNVLAFICLLGLIGYYEIFSEIEFEPIVKIEGEFENPLIELSKERELLLGAIGGGDIKKVHKILNAKVDLNFVAGSNKYGPLHVATVNRCRPDIVSFLLKNGAKVNQKDIRGRTPLDLSIRRNCLSSTLILKDAGGERYIASKKTGREVASKINSTEYYLNYVKSKDN